MNLELETLESIEAPELSFWQGVGVVAGAFVVGAATGAIVAVIVT